MYINRYRLYYLRNNFKLSGKTYKAPGINHKKCEQIYKKSISYQTSNSYEFFNNTLLKL